MKKGGSTPRRSKVFTNNTTPTEGVDTGLSLEIVEHRIRLILPLGIK